MNGFSLSRFLAIIHKEFIQMIRDRATLAMMVGIPLLQLVIFGFAINSDPKHLPTAIISEDNSIFSRRIIAAAKNSGYFNIIFEPRSDEEASELLDTGRVQFVIQIPRDFSRKLVRGQRPDLLIEADATDPSAIGNALNAFNALLSTTINRDLQGISEELIQNQSPVNLVAHRRYNPEIVSAYNVVPGLMGVVITLTMVVITALSITRERERGTMESLLAAPLQPLEVMIGKLIPYILVGYAQIFLILIAARFIFDVPMIGSVTLLLLSALLFIIGNLAVGITFSTLAKNQLQAAQMAIFFFLPSLLLSGFMFPFYGMPLWAQKIGSVLPLTHFLRVARGILLKGNGLYEV
ncbi:MAG: ABC transporter permease, partial [SAR324 cluster bacterium]|nr:ABC transporter permease [SAR324 cluster bacterium]